MTFKYSVLLKARFGGPFVLSENTRLLLYMPKWRFQSILRCFLAYPHATCRKNECVKYIAFPYIADTLWNALLSPLYRVLFHTFHRVFHTIILQNYVYLYITLFCSCMAVCSCIVDTTVYICRNMSAIGDTYVRNCWIIFHSFKLKIGFPHILRKSFAQGDGENCRLLKVRVLSFRFASFLLFFNTVTRASLSISRRQKRHTHFTLHVPLLSPI